MHSLSRDPNDESWVGQFDFDSPCACEVAAGGIDSLVAQPLAVAIRFLDRMFQISQLCPRAQREVLRRIILESGPRTGDPKWLEDLAETMRSGDLDRRRK